MRQNKITNIEKNLDSNNSKYKFLIFIFIILSLIFIRESSAIIYESISLNTSQLLYQNNIDTTDQIISLDPLTVENQSNKIMNFNFDKGVYSVGDIVLITILDNRNFQEKSVDTFFTIENINNPQYIYKNILGNALTMDFIPAEFGEYKITSYTEENGIIKILGEDKFTVYSDCKIMSQGNSIIINTTFLNKWASELLSNTDFLNIDMLIVFQDNSTQKLRYHANTSVDVIYTPAREGKYYIIANDVIKDCYQLSVTPDDSLSNIKNINEYDWGGVNSFLSSSSSGSNKLNVNPVDNFISNQRNYVSDLELKNMIGENILVDENKTLRINQKMRQSNKTGVYIVDENNKYINSYVVIKDYDNNKITEGDMETIQDSVSTSKNSDVDIYFSSSEVKKIRFKKSDYSKSNISIKFNYPPKEKLLLGNFSLPIESVFALDPTSMNYSYAELTFIASGNSLWKCKDYDFYNYNCFGEFIKILDTVPGKEYTILLDSKDPVFVQSNYLTNPSFDTNITTGWTQLTETSCPQCTYVWNDTDGAQSGVAEIRNLGNNRNATLNYYQLFNMTVPNGTNITNVSFSVLWRIPTYSLPGVVGFWIQNSARTSTYCTINQSFGTTNAWSTFTMNAPGDCSLGNFTANTNYTFRLRCNLVTSSGARDEKCHWDEANVSVYYIDVQSPIIRSFNSTPNPVNYSSVINITVNVTDNIAVSAVWILINGTNYTMSFSSGSGLYYFDAFNTAIYPKNYNYTIYANDTSSYNASNSSGNFTINDTVLPKVNLMTPLNGAFTNTLMNFFYFNVSDESTFFNCSLLIDNVIKMTNTSIINATTIRLNSTLTYGLHYWNITCYDNSTNKNRNTSITRNITLDNVTPIISIFYPTNNIWISGGATSTINFNYSFIDDYIQNCSLYLNTSGSWAINQTNSTVINNTNSSFSQVMPDGAQLWNVQCCDMGTNCAFNSINFTARIDSTPPWYNNSIANPQNNSVYSTPITYQFNISWNDSLTNLSRVWLETNITDAFVNYSVSNISTLYYYQTTNIAAGNYAYRWYANDTVNNVNITPFYAYIVQKNNATLSLLLNGSASDIVINQGDYVNISASINNPTNGHIEIYVEGNMTNSGNGFLQNISQYPQQRQYNVTLVYNTTRNYSQTYITRYITVIDNQPPTVSLGNPQNYSWQPRAVTLYYTPNDNIDIINCTLILDGLNTTIKNATIAIENNFTLNLSDGLHNWTVGCIDSFNNYGYNTTPKYVQIDTISPTAFNLSLPLNGTISNNNVPTLMWNATNETNFLNYTILVDNNINFVTPYKTYYITNISNTSYNVIAGDEWSDNKWYWKVIAYDVVFNSNTSQIYEYTVDTTAPDISIISPSDDYYSKYLIQNFTFTITDYSEIVNCSLVINGLVNQTNNTINKSLTQVFTQTFGLEGTYNWSINCTDVANNKQNTSMRNITIETTGPAQFNLTSPGNSTMSNNNTPLFNWTQTIEPHFLNYTLQVSDLTTFANINYTFNTYTIQNTSYQSSTITDGIWYWRVLAYDLAINNYTTDYYSYTIDTLPPVDFVLQYPTNNSASSNQSPLLNWSNTTDIYFKNYTIEVSTNKTFSYINYTYSTLSVQNTTYQVITWPMNIQWYWRVIAYDYAYNNYTTGYYRYTTDNATPNVTLISPSQDAIWNSSSVIDFNFTVSDTSDIINCSLLVDGENVVTIYNINKDTNQTIQYSLANGIYNWSINCSDKANYEGNSSERNLTVNLTLPIYTYWETSTSTTSAESAPMNYNLSPVYDFSENSVQQTVATTDYNIANATINFNGTGFILYSGSLINFSAVFTPSANNRGRVNWGLYFVNTSGMYIICQTPNGTSGVLIPTRNVKNTVIGSCVSPNYNINLNANDEIILRVNVYGGTSATYTHYVDNANPSYVQIPGYKKGILSATLVNTTDQQPGEDYSFVEPCNISCTDGYCLGTIVTYQYNNSQTGIFTGIGITGNIILNDSQINPETIGTINSTYIANASLYATNYSFNNTFRCVANSSYSDAVSTSKNITIRDITNPTVNLVSPQNNYATNPSIISFVYTPYDKRLQNCSLYTNITGSFAINQTNATPLNNQSNQFTLNLSYGKYLWNIQCCDIVGNCAFNTTNRTLNIAGDLTLNTTDITFSNNNPAEGENVTLYAFIRNAANRTEQNVLIRFYEGDPDSGGLQIGIDIFKNLSALGNATVNVSWIAVAGNHTIYVKIDPTDTVIESDENNNKASNVILISIWQTYYGNYSTIMILSDPLNRSVINWSIAGPSAKVFIADSDASISWTFLKAIGRDINDNLTTNTSNDFEDIDVCLNTTDINGSVNSTYTIDGAPRSNDTYVIYSNTINHVPQVQSTNNTNFYTGILWDSDDSPDDYFSCNPTPALRYDIVFVTKISQNQNGKYGMYDYELKVPAKLKSYKGAVETMTLYYEIS